MSEPGVAELMSMLSQLQAEVSGMKVELAQARAQAPTAQTVQEKSTSRRRMLKKLGAGMLVAGVAASAGLASQTKEASAKVFDGPQGNVGAVIQPGGGLLSGSFPGGRSVGLIASTELTVNLSAIPGPTYSAVIGYSNANATGVYGYSSSSHGIYGYSSSSYGAYGESDTGEGVHAKSVSSFGLAAESTNGIGILGKSINGHAIVGDAVTGYGVWAKSSGGHGLVAETTSSNTTHCGIWAKGNATAILAESPKDAVIGKSTAGGTGVLGTTTTGSGVQGVASTAAGIAVHAIAQQNGIGVHATSAGGIGIYGISTTGTGIQGNSIGSYGIYGESANYTGIYGRTSGVNQAGVIGNSSDGHGVRGISITKLGVQGQSESGHGVRGGSQSGFGMWGSSTSSTGVVASSTTGSPFKIIAGSQPTTGTREVGEMYVDSTGSLWIYNGTAWKKVVVA